MWGKKNMGGHNCIIFSVCLMYLVLLDECNINSLQLQAELHEKM